MLNSSSTTAPDQSQKNGNNRKNQQNVYDRSDRIHKKPNRPRDNENDGKYVQEIFHELSFTG